MTPSKKRSKIRRSVIFPIIMLVYLAAMAWIGRDRLERGEYLYYFGIIGIGLVIIVLLYLSLRKKEELQQRKVRSRQLLRRVRAGGRVTRSSLRY